jgi:uncharacterized protein
MERIIMKLIKLIVAAMALALSFTTVNASAADAPAKAKAKHMAKVKKEKVVLQVSDADPGKWNLTLNVAKNIQQSIGADKSEVEIVVFGPGIGMLKIDSPIAGRIADAKSAGVTVVACENTMKGMKLTGADMLPNTAYVPAGAVELMHKEKEGYAYLRP